MTSPYGSTVLEHFRRPRNQRVLSHPTAGQEAYNPLCGDRVRVEIDVRESVIRDAGFTANACAICTASASLLTERVRELSVDTASAITDAELIASLGADIPDARVACAVLPARALRAALALLPPE